MDVSRLLFCIRFETCVVVIVAKGNLLFGSRCTMFMQGLLFMGILAFPLLISSDLQGTLCHHIVRDQAVRQQDKGVV